MAHHPHTPHLVQLYLEVASNLVSPSDTIDRLCMLSFEPMIEAATAMIEAVPGYESEAKPDEATHAFFCHAQAIFKKAFFHFKALADLRLARPVTIRDKGQQLLLEDFVSAPVLARILFENVVIFRYIFGRETHDECLFWYNTWDLNGHQKRDYFGDQPSGKDPSKTMREANPEKFEVIRKNREACYARLTATDFFKKLPRKMAECAVAGRWREIELTVRTNNHGDEYTREIPWGELAVATDLRERLGTLGYKHNCSYIHTDSISAWQIAEADAKGGQGLYYSSAAESFQYFANAIETYCRIWSQLRDLEAVRVAEPFTSRWLSLGKPESKTAEPDSTSSPSKTAASPRMKLTVDPKTWRGPRDLPRKVYCEIALKDEPYPRIYVGTSEEVAVQYWLEDYPGPPDRVIRIRQYSLSEPGPFREVSCKFEDDILILHPVEPSGTEVEGQETLNPSE